jgi:hypothetical protein
MNRNSVGLDGLSHFFLIHLLIIHTDLDQRMDQLVNRNHGIEKMLSVLFCHDFPQ